MTRMTACKTIVITTLLSTSAVALGDDKKPEAAAMPIPTPAPELEAFMKAFEGNWKCDTKFPAGAFGPGSPEVSGKSIVKIKKDLKGFWYSASYELLKSKTVPGFKGLFFFGYDAAAKQLINLSIDDTGGMSVERGAIQGDSATLTGDAVMMGMKGKIRETMTKKGKEVVHTVEMDMGKGFQPMGGDTCKK